MMPCTWLPDISVISYEFVMQIIISSTEITSDRRHQLVSMDTVCLVADVDSDSNSFHTAMKPRARLTIAVEWEVRFKSRTRHGEFCTYDRSYLGWFNETCPSFSFRRCFCEFTHRQPTIVKKKTSLFNIHLTEPCAVKSSSR